MSKLKPGDLIKLDEDCPLWEATAVKRGIGIVLEKAVLKSVYKHEAYWLVHWFNNSHHDCAYRAEHLKLITT